MGNLKTTLANDLKDTKNWLGMPLLFFAAYIGLYVLGTLTDTVKPGILYTLPMLLLMGFISVFIGDRIPFWKDWLGGGVTFTLIVATFFKSNLPATTLKNLKDFYDGSQILIWLIGFIILCSIMQMNRKVLMRAFLGYIPAILAGTLVSYILTGFVGMILGYGFKEAILFVAQPIIGGGMGAGAIPMSQIYASAGKNTVDHYLAVLAAAVIVGNMVSVLYAAVLNNLGKKYPSITGNGNLLKVNDPTLASELEAEKTKPKASVSIYDIAWITVTAGVFMIAGTLLNKYVPIKIHTYAWMIIFTIVMKVLKVFPERFYDACGSFLSQFLYLSVPLSLIGIGLFYLDFNTFIASVSDPVFLILCIVAVGGAVLGSGLFGVIVKFYFVESALCAGLCMANMGGDGDIMVLSAAKRMNLLPFAQISSRIGGAIILLIAGALSGLL